jgi:hypothetical protein
MIQPISPTPRITAKMPSMEPIFNLSTPDMRLIDWMRKHRHGTVLVSYQDGVPTVITPVNTDAKLKLA